MSFRELLPYNVLARMRELESRAYIQGDVAIAAALRLGMGPASETAAHADLLIVTSALQVHDDPQPARERAQEC
jgi:hypothetical protein